MLSATAFGTGVIFITKLTKKHSAMAVMGSSLFIPGLVLAAAMWLIRSPAPTGAPDWTALLLFSLLPLAAALTYVVGLSRIGASLTSVIGSFSILLTVAFQLILIRLGAEAMLPANIPLAVAGGVMGSLASTSYTGQKYSLRRSFSGARDRRARSAARRSQTLLRTPRTVGGADARRLLTP
jgi:drug/metabolite transporter (DMT)-like permease